MRGHTQLSAPCALPVSARRWLVAVVLMLAVQGAYAQSATPTPATPHVQPNPSVAVQDELDHIVRSEEYSKIGTTSHWERNTPPKSKEPSAFEKWLDKLFEDLDLSTLSGLSQGVGLIGKTIALLFLAGLVWWLYKTRQVWLSWLSTFRRPTTAKSTPAPTPIWREQERDWVDLPPSAELAEFISSLLAQGLWLPALSALYRGTLRELGVRHHLPIDHHQTENQCQWLLAQSQAGSQEREYFDKLVMLWRASAYGQKIPKDGNHSDIHALLHRWTVLYGGRA